MLPNLLGNVPDWKIISKIAKRYNLKVIGDSADTIGYKIHGKNLVIFQTLLQTVCMRLI